VFCEKRMRLMRLHGIDREVLFARTSVPTSRSLSMEYYLELLRNQEVTDRKLEVVEFARMNPYHFTIQPRPARPRQMWSNV
jgi:hypothetical protein